MQCTLFIWEKCIGAYSVYIQNMVDINVRVREVKSSSKVGKK